MDRADVLEQLWQVRDLVSEIDDCAAAQIHTIYNQLVIGDLAL